MAKKQLGTKRICPETGKKFYDLDRDPVVSPYTGISYPISAFDLVAKKATKPEEPEVTEKPAEEDESTEAVTPEGVEIVSLEDAEPTVISDDDDDDDNADVIPDIDTSDIDSDDDPASETDDTFLEDEDDDSPAVAVVVSRDDDDM